MLIRPNHISLMSIALMLFSMTTMTIAEDTSVSSVALAKTAARTVVCMNDGWTFAPVEETQIRELPIRSYQRGDDITRESTGPMQEVRLPHDWAIHQKFDPKIGGSTGMLPWFGVGIYQRHFRPNNEDRDKRFVLEFDGCMSFPEVSVNGKYAGGWDYGYLGFQVDITPFLQFDGDNTDGDNTDGDNIIEVRCDTREHKSRWYPGLGLYRPVRLIVCSSEAWLPEGSVRITTPEVTPVTPAAGSARVVIDVAPSIEHCPDDGIQAVLTLLDNKGKTIASEMKKVETACSFSVSISEANLWDVDSPALYCAQIQLTDGHGTALDSLEIPFGIRKVEWTNNDGFYLNGRRVQLKGVDLHHDQGILGAAAHPVAIARQLRIMRDMGINAVRTSHNPLSPDFMALCDQLGLIVWDELFDKWEGTCGLRPEDDFFEFTARQVKRFVERDVNHPSVCVWSIGNEIWSIEGNLPDASNPNQQADKRVQHLIDCFHQNDPTRLTGMGCFCDNEIRTENKVYEILDIMGWNYGGKYQRAHECFPTKPLVYTESASALSTRDYYDPIHPPRKDVYNAETKQVDSYDLTSADGPRDIPDIDFERMNIDRYVAGEFVWTGFDYIGEPCPFDNDAKSSYFGIVDLCGIPKDRFYLYRSYWNNEAVTVHILPHWNWPDSKGQKVPVYVYTNGDTVELFLNGKSLGKKTKDASRSLNKPEGVAFDLPDYYWVIDKYRLRWEDVVYEPGTLEAVAWKDGQEIGRAHMQTAAEPVRLRLTPETDALQGNDDLCYILVEAVDASGTVCPESMEAFSVTVTGAELVGIGNGNPLGMEPLSDAAHSLFYGKAMIVLRSLGTSVEGTTRTSRTAEVTVLGQTLPVSNVTIQVVP